MKDINYPKHLIDKLDYTDFLDDIFDSGATIKEIGRMLTEMGATEIAPLVIAKTIGGDDL